MTPIYSEQALSTLIKDIPLVLVYFLGGTCAACWAIQGEVEKILADFPHVAAVEVTVEDQPALAAAYSVFAVPTAVLFTAGKEALRFGRHVDLGGFRRQLARYSDLLQP